MELYLAKSPQGQYLPASTDDKEKSNKIGVGEICKVKTVKARNYQFHKKFFALLQHGFDNQDVYDNFEVFRKEVIMRAGYFDMHTHLSGKVSIHPKSIKFEKMDEYEFSELYSKSIDVILQNFMVGSTEEELNRVLGFI